MSGYKGVHSKYGQEERFRLLEGYPTGSQICGCSDGGPVGAGLASAQPKIRRPALLHPDASRRRVRERRQLQAREPGVHSRRPAPHCAGRYIRRGRAWVYTLINAHCCLQFCANDPVTLLKAARLAQPHCEAIDLNLGCPQAIAKRVEVVGYPWKLSQNSALSLCLVTLRGIGRTDQLSNCGGTRLVSPWSSLVELAAIAYNYSARFAATHSG